MKKRPFQLIDRDKPAKGLRRTKYPWDKITTGRPLFIRARKMQDVSSSAYAAARRMGLRFTLRRVDGGVEVHLAS